MVLKHRSWMKTGSAAGFIIPNKVMEHDAKNSLYGNQGFVLALTENMVLLPPY